MLTSPSGMSDVPPSLRSSIWSLRDRDQLAVLRGVAQHDRVGAILGEQAGQRLAVLAW